MISIGFVLCCIAVLVVYLTDTLFDTYSSAGEWMFHLALWLFVFGGFSIAAGAYAWLSNLPPF